MGDPGERVRPWGPGERWSCLLVPPLVRNRGLSVLHVAVAGVEHAYAADNFSQADRVPCPPLVGQRCRGNCGRPRKPAPATLPSTSLSALAAIIDHHRGLRLLRIN